MVYFRMTGIFLLCLFTWATPSLAESSETTVLSPTPLHYPAVQNFINKMVTRYQFDRQELQQLFQQVTFLPSVVQTMEKPFESKPWYIYRQSLLTPERIQQGVIFWQKNEKILEQVSREYGVPPEVILGVLGIETFYGTQQGKYLLINSLSTLAFTYPKRAAFFEEELTQLLLMARENQLDLMTLKGSYAGAFGLPQFMPSSYRRYAVDYTGDGKKDLINSEADAIASVAHYLKENGWQSGEPICETLSSSPPPDLILTHGRKPNLTLSQLQTVHIYPKLMHSTNKVMILSMEGEKGPLYWIAYQNFSAIMSYNPRVPYAMVVWDLSNELVKARKQLIPTHA